MIKTRLIDLQVLTNSPKYVVDEEKVHHLAETLLESLGLNNQELSLLIVDDEKIRELNKTYRNKNTSTDVLSFPQNEFEEPLCLDDKETSKQELLPGLLGDIIISLETTQNNSVSLGHSIAREFCFLLIHGLLHLCGHDHIESEEEKIMLEQQKLLLKQVERNTDREATPLWEDCITIKEDLK